MSLVVVVSGAAGFVGKNLLTALSADPAVREIHAVDLLALPPEVARLAKVRGRVEDIGTSAVIAEVRPTHVVHLAGSAGVRASDDDPLHYIDNNLRATVHVFEEAKRYGVRRVLYASSSSAYGPSAPLPLTETNPQLTAGSVYGMSKQMCETVARYYHGRHGLPSIGFRFFTVYGPHGRLNMAIGAFVKAIREGTALTVYGDGSQIRDYTYVGDVVAAVTAGIHAAGAGADGADVLNVGAGDTCSVMELIGLIEEAVGSKAVVVHGPRHPADVPATRACNDRLAATLGVRPKIKLREGLRLYLDWLRSREDDSHT